MQLSREDIVVAAEKIDLSIDEYTVHGDFKGWNFTGCAGVVVPVGKLTPLMVSLALVLAADGRCDDSLKIATDTQTEQRGLNIAAYWPGVDLTD